MRDADGGILIRSCRGFHRERTVLVRASREIVESISESNELTTSRRFILHHGAGAWHAVSVSGVSSSSEQETNEEKEKKTRKSIRFVWCARRVLGSVGHDAFNDTRQPDS
jgi:hypothetical protein